ncbi:MAG: tetratricopeptide repeat protein [Acidobacteriota bacterium]
MQIRNLRVLGAGLGMALGLSLLARHPGPVAAAAGPAPLALDYPLNGSVFPPEITAPTFLWHDATPATRWVITIEFAHAAPLRVQTEGKLFEGGPIDAAAGLPPELTKEQRSTHTWTPEAAIWAQFKHKTIDAPARITMEGFAGGQTNPISRASIQISTSSDPVGAPIFYRDVPLMLPAADQKGPITPLPTSALPLIKWRLRDLSQPQSRVVMENLPTCANCHSFSRDGKVFGLDMDGPRNDKGLYALVPVSRNITIRTQDMIHWSSFQLNDEARAGQAAVKRFGFMSQVSPNGRYVVTSIGPPNPTNKNGGQQPGFAPGILDRLYSTNYRSLAFTQVFYPTRGILAWYDRSSGTMRPLPGADDPKYVQTSAFWSPDGKYLIFSRALARDPYPKGAQKAMYANDPNETQIQYDLYKIPFNDGRGGKAVPVLGASNNGMSNNFPKVSPDGKWIVFVECKNGLLMRPDSRLFIVPFEGGKARPLNANTKLMNSWHTFSPNGRWLAFSSKARGPYTRLMLTHMDANGNDTPAIMVENSTAYNRAVNIPEFVNLPPGQTIAKIDPQATEFYRLFDLAFKQIESGNMPEAIRLMRETVARDPSDGLGHYVLATALTGNNQEAEALVEYRKAVQCEPENPNYLNHLAISLDLNGDSAGAERELRKAIGVDPSSAEYQFNLGTVLEARGDYAASIDPLMKSVEYSGGHNWRCFAKLAEAYAKTGRAADAITAAEQAIAGAEQAGDSRAAAALKDTLDRYRGAAGSKAAR